MLFSVTGVSGARDSACPRICPQGSSEEPVCGSDGIIYPNECELKKKTCGKGKNNTITCIRILEIIQPQ